MSWCPFIGLEGERGGRASEMNGGRRWCTIMVMKAAVSEGDRAGSDEGGECSGHYGSGRGRGAGRWQRTCETAAAASWLSGRRRKMKGWGPRVSEGEGRAGPSQLGGQGQEEWGGGESRLAEGQGPGGWYGNPSWA
jgi:hypothetical protein